MISATAVLKLVVKVVERIALIVGAVVFCFLTIVLAIYDRSNAATVTAALTVAFMAFYFLPFFESFEAFGLKAKLRSQVMEAETLLDHMRRTAIASAKISYLDSAWANRWGSASWSTKMENLGAVENNLKSLDVDAETIRKLKEPVLRMAAIDLYAPLVHMIYQRLRVRRNELQVQLNGAANDDAHASISQAIEALKNPEWDSNTLMESETFDFPAFIADRFNQTHLPQNDIDAMQPFRDRIVRLEGECRKKARFTAEMIEVLEEFANTDSWKRFYKKFFPEDTEIKLPD